MDDGSIRQEQGQEETAQRQQLAEATDELVGLLSGKARGWAEIYRQISRVEEGRLWVAGGYGSMTKWIEDLARRAHVHVQYLWRVKKAGRFYSAYAARHQDAPPMSEARIGDEMLADLDRVSEGSDERADAYVAAALRGEITKSKVKELVRATSARRRARAAMASGDASADTIGHEVDGAATGGASEHPARAQATDVLAAITPEALFGTTDERVGRRLLRSERRVFHVLSEFPIRSATSDHARRVDAMVVTNVDAGQGAHGLPGCPPDAVTLHGIEIKVSELDLRRDTKHLEYEAYSDYLWFAMPASLYSAVAQDAGEWLSEGWGVLVLGEDGRMSVAVPAQHNDCAAMRDVSLMTALVRMASTA